MSGWQRHCHILPRSRLRQLKIIKSLRVIQRFGLRIIQSLSLWVGSQDLHLRKDYRERGHIMRNDIRNLERRIIEISYKMGLSHIGSNLTALPLIYAAYEKMQPRDKFVLSNGHAHLAHLVVMEKINKWLELQEERIS